MEWGNILGYRPIANYSVNILGYPPVSTISMSYSNLFLPLGLGQASTVGRSDRELSVNCWGVHQSNHEPNSHAPTTANIGYRIPLDTYSLSRLTCNSKELHKRNTHKKQGFFVVLSLVFVVFPSCLYNGKGAFLS